MVRRSRIFLVLGCLALVLAHPAPAATAQAPQQTKSGLRIVSTAQMGPQDAELLRARRADLESAVRFHGYDLRSGTWIQSQVLCPYAPKYIILHNVQLDQGGLVSLFTALIPRKGGQVRIIPVLLHGTQALQRFTSSPSYWALVDDVISAPLHAQVPSQDADWSTLAYCYGALAGAEPMASGPADFDHTVPRLALNENGQLREMSFSTVGPDNVNQNWTIQFGARGKLKSIRLSMRELNPVHAVPQAPRRSAQSVPSPSPGTVKSVPPPQ